MPPARLPFSKADRLEAIHGYEELATPAITTAANVVALAADLTGCPVSYISLVGMETERLLARQGTRLVEQPLEHSFCAHAILSPDAATMVADARLDARFADNPLVTGSPGVRLYAARKLVDRYGIALGTLCVLDHVSRALDDQQRAILNRLADTALAALEMSRSMADMARLTMVDDLTGLCNRSALMSALSKAIARHKRHNEKFALVYLDLDGLKQVNDRSGHAAGDNVLRIVAGVLAAGVRTEDLAARLGGDEFALLLVGDPPNPAIPAERIRAEIERQCALRDWPVTASVGVVSFRVPPVGVAVALGLADTMMYRAKNSGRNRLASFVFEGVG